MFSFLLQRGPLRPAPPCLSPRSDAAAAAVQRAALAGVALGAHRTFLTSPLSLAAAADASKPIETAATDTKKSASKSTTTTVAGESKAKKSVRAMGTNEPPKRLTVSELPPTRAPSPWNFFLVKYHGLGNGVKSTTSAEGQKTLKAAAAAWRRLSDAEKKPYFEQAEAAKADLVKQRAKFWMNAPEELIMRLDLDRKEDPTSRRHAAYKTVSSPKTSYVFFIRDYLNKTQRDESITQTEFVKQGAVIWDGMSETQRAPFTDLARKDMERFRQEMAAAASG